MTTCRATGTLIHKWNRPKEVAIGKTFQLTNTVPLGFPPQRSLRLKETMTLVVQNSAIVTQAEAKSFTARPLATVDEAEPGCKARLGGSDLSLASVWEFQQNALWITRMAGLLQLMVESAKGASPDASTDTNKRVFELGRARSVSKYFDQVARVADAVGTAAKEFAERLEDDCLMASLTQQVSANEDDGWSADQQDALQQTWDQLSTKRVWERAGREGAELKVKAENALQRTVGKESRFKDEITQLEEACEVYESGFAGLLKGEQNPFKGTNDPIYKTYLKVEALLEDLDAVLKNERTKMSSVVDKIIRLVNEGTFADVKIGSDDARQQLTLDILNGRKSSLGFEEIVSAVLHQDEASALAASNMVGLAASPQAVLAEMETSVDGAYQGLPASRDLNLAVNVSMFRSIRICQIGRTADLARNVQDELEKLVAMLVQALLLADSEIKSYWAESGSRLLEMLAKRVVGYCKGHLSRAVTMCKERLLVATQLVEAHSSLYTRGGLGHTLEDCVDAVTIAMVLVDPDEPNVVEASNVPLSKPALCRGIVDLARRGCAWGARKMPAVRSDEVVDKMDKKRDLVTEALSLLETITNSLQNLAGSVNTERSNRCKHKQASQQLSSSTRETYVFDPRLVAFEFITGFMLRQTQVDLVDDFVDRVDHKLSSVVQMIMGGGKTSVVAPLLSLFLADGNRLVTLLCPDQLLPQSMAEIGGKYSQIIRRQVHAFKFTRQETSAENYEQIMEGYDPKTTIKTSSSMKTSHLPCKCRRPRNIPTPS